MGSIVAKNMGSLVTEDGYIFKFRAESSGGKDVLEFASNADVAAIWPNFTTRTIDGILG
ncbi:hypothetical protein ACTXKV_10860 [Psychrobacter cibarius]|uniref:hypothetical protein n=1 Tax=Psychrobacter cibarius TaxID=282669 RepID=UPI003FD5847D